MVLSWVVRSRVSLPKIRLRYFDTPEYSTSTGELYFCSLSSNFSDDGIRVTGNAITAEDALGFEQSLPAGTPPPESEQPQEESRALTFAELKELIEQGKTDNIPNNRLIPDNLNVRYTNPQLTVGHLIWIQDDTPSLSKAAIRPKPWESADVAVPIN